ncbi:MAG: hypothetical protein Q9170_006541 [Blastenia crenularia]
MARRSLRRVLSIPEVQDQIFGDKSVGGLDWGNYNDVQVVVGPVVREQGGSGDRFFPIRCKEWRADAIGILDICDRQAGPSVEVRRCEGFMKDPGAPRGEGAPDFPVGILHRYLHDENTYFPFKRWDAPTGHQAHRGHAQPVCAICVVTNYRERPNMASFVTDVGLKGISLGRIELIVGRRSYCTRTRNKAEEDGRMWTGKNRQEQGQLVPPRTVEQEHGTALERRIDWV